MGAVAIIDYGMGNVRSVANAVDYCGADPVVTADPQEIADASHLILPGVGAFGDAMTNLRRRGLDEVLHREVREKGKPMLGVCLGMQVLAGVSREHGDHQGLGWFDADVVRIIPETPGLKVPHTGWNEAAPTRSHPIFAGLAKSRLTFYFVHSFHMRCRDEADRLAIFEHGGRFTAAVARDNIVATQFHPEKSQDSGVRLLTNFIRWRP